MWEIKTVNAQCLSAQRIPKLWVCIGWRACLICGKRHCPKMISMKHLAASQILALLDRSLYVRAWISRALLGALCVLTLLPWCGVRLARRWSFSLASTASPLELINKTGCHKGKKSASLYLGVCSLQPTGCHLSKCHNHACTF